jgi:hypothetical protein
MGIGKMPIPAARPKPSELRFTPRTLSSMSFPFANAMRSVGGECGDQKKFIVRSLKGVLGRFGVASGPRMRPLRPIQDAKLPVCCYVFQHSLLHIVHICPYKQSIGTTVIQMRSFVSRWPLKNVRNDLLLNPLCHKTLRH